MKKFTTTTNHSFEISVPNFQLSTEQVQELKTAIYAGIEQEEPTERKNLLSAIVAYVNKEFKDMASFIVMRSDDVLKNSCLEVNYGKLTVCRDGDSVVVNYDLAMHKVKVGKVDKTPIYENRPDFVQYTDVVKIHNLYNSTLKKDGYKDGYALKGGISAHQFNLLTILTHNLAGRLTEKDIEKLEKMGEEFACFAGTSNTQRLKAVQFWYDLFNARTGKNHKAIGFIVEELKNDKRLATFDSHHYIDTVVGEYTLLSVLISHYINTGRSVIKNSKAKNISGVMAE